MEFARYFKLDFCQGIIREFRVHEIMLAKEAISLERTAPRYTSYPTAPHFGPAVDEGTYASWLNDLSRSNALSFYLHVPFCEKICLYCGCNTKATRRVEPIELYAERLIGEINLVAENTACRKLVHLHWGGGTPSILGSDRLREIVAQLAARYDLSVLREHAIELDPRFVTKTLAAALVDIGVTRASLGVQDLSDHVQQAIGRIQPLTLVQRAVDILREVGIDQINIDLMYGLPKQSEQDVQRTAILAHQLKPQRLAVFGYAHVPWFKSHQRLLSEAMLPASAERFAQAKAARETLTSLGYEPIGLDHYASPSDSLAIAARGGKLRRNFQGYTTDDADALLGLGTSAIGRLQQGFVQNPPDTGSYSRAIMSGRLATVKGLALSTDDHIRGRIIEELMCNLSCDIDQITEDCGHRCASFEQEIKTLLPFVANGFAHVDGRHIAVTESGRPYLRLIAAAFDSYVPNSRAHHSAAV